MTDANDGEDDDQKDEIEPMIKAAFVELNRCDPYELIDVLLSSRMCTQYSTYLDYTSRQTADKWAKRVKFIYLFHVYLCRTVYLSALQALQQEFSTKPLVPYEDMKTFLKTLSI